MTAINFAESLTSNAFVTSQVDLIWQMAKASLAATNQQVLINTSVYQMIGDAGVEEIKLRLSEFLGNVPVIACIDRANEVVRVMKHDELHRSTNSDTKVHHRPSQIDTRLSPSCATRSPTPVQRAFGKKIKVPRPPNAFILYRQHWHPHYKQENRDMHNNEISKELGKRWKAEPDSVKERYKSLAEDLKKRHATLYPDYQYAPRKPGEKKRRMTARKLEKLRQAHNVQEAVACSLPEYSKNCGVDSPNLHISIGHDIDSMMTPSPINDLGSSPSPVTPPRPVEFQEDDTFICTLPSSFDNIQAEIDKECGTYGDNYVDVAEHNSNLNNVPSGTSGLQAVPSASQIDQQNEWESLIDWHGLNCAITESADLTEDHDQDLIAEQRSGPDQSHKSYEEPTLSWR